LWGYGWGKAISRVPYVGGAIANIVEAGALGGPIAGGVAAAVEATEGLAFNKQAWGNIATGVESHAQRFMDLQGDALAAGRAGGFSGREGLKSFYDDLNTPQLMRALGLHPEDAQADLKQFGIVQGSPEARASLVQQLEVPKYSAAYSDMDQTENKGFAAGAARYGVTSGDAAGAQKYFATLATTMEGATARGMDRASILRSIDASLSGSAARSASSINLGETADFVGRLGNLPGGRTGELGVSAGATLDDAAHSVGSNPTTSFAYMLAAKRTTTPAALEALLGHKLSATEQETASYYFENLKAGDIGTAGKFLSELTIGNKTAINSVLTGPGSPASMAPHRLGPIASSGSTGLSVTESVQLGNHPRSVIASHSPMPPGTPLGAPTAVFDEDKVKSGEYERQLFRMGVRGDLIPVLIEEGRRAKINPLTAGATMMGESSGGFKDRVNVMQIKGSSGLVRRGSDITSARQSIRLGYQVEQTMLDRFGGDVTKMHGGYEGPAWGTDANAGYEGAIRDAYARAGANPDTSNIPERSNDLISGAGAAGVRGSEASLDQNAITTFNATINSTGTALDRLAKAADRARESQDWYRHVSPLGAGVSSIP
jgi:hypothetical protein